MFKKELLCSLKLMTLFIVDALGLLNIDAHAWMHHQMHVISYFLKVVGILFMTCFIPLFV